MNAADEAQKQAAGTAGSRTSNQLIVWTLKNTASLNTTSPAVSLSNRVLTVGRYGVPPKQQQPEDPQLKKALELLRDKPAGQRAS